MPMTTAKSLIFRIFLVRDQEVGGSNPLAPTKFLKDLQTPNNDVRVRKGSIFGPTPTRMLDSGSPCSRVLIDLPPDDFEDPLGSYQEVCDASWTLWCAERSTG